MLALMPVVLAQSKTLRDEVREKGYAKHGFSEELPRSAPHTLDRLIKESSLIICGEVVNEVPRLTQDDSMVMTDYAIKITGILKDPLQLMNVGDRIVVSKFGGNILLEGKPVEWATPGFPAIPWHISSIFFVAHANTPNQYWENTFVLANIGVWRFDAGKLQCETRQKKEAGYTASLCGKPEEEVLKQLQQRITAQRSTNQ